MNLLEGIPPEVVAQLPRVWGTNRAGMGVRTIDPRAVKAWRERHRIEQAVVNDLPAPAQGEEPLEEVEIDEQALAQLTAEPSEKRDRKRYEAIIEAACRLHRVDRARMLGPSKSFSVVSARHHAIYETRRQCPWLSTPQIGKIFGRDHSTIVYALQWWPEKAKAFGLEVETPTVWVGSNGPRDEQVPAQPPKTGPYADDELSRIEALWAAGKGARKIARLVGRRPGAISRLAASDPTRFKPRVWVAKRALGMKRLDRAEIFSWRAEGKTTREIATIMRCSERLVSKVVEEPR